MSQLFPRFVPKVFRGCPYAKTQNGQLFAMQRKKAVISIIVRFREMHCARIVSRILAVCIFFGVSAV